MKRGLLAAVLLAVVLPAACGEPAKMPLQVKTPEEAGVFFQNPLPISGIGDPYVLKTDDAYYLYATSSSTGYFCWRSEDLVHWEDPVLCYDACEQENAWSYGEFWAPEVAAYQNEYYLFYSSELGTEEGMRIGVAKADSPQGPFREAIGQPLFDDGWMAIDADVLFAPDGTPYLYYSRDCSQNEVNGVGTSQIHVIRLTEDLLGTVGAPKQIATPWQPWELVSVDPLWNEGPEVFYRDGLYYLLYSANYYGAKNYSLGLAVSDRPDGGFAKYEKNPVLAAADFENISGTGHNGIAASPDGREAFLVYHSHTDPDIGGGNRQVNLCRFSVSGADMAVNGPLLGWQHMPSREDSHLLQAAAAAAGQELPGMTDGIAAIHPEQTERDVFLGRGKQKIELTLSSPGLLESIVLYRSSDGSSGITRIRLTIDDRYEAEMPLFSEMPEERTTVLAFEPVAAQKITVLVEGDLLSLSEIELWGRETG